MIKISTRMLICALTAQLHAYQQQSDMSQEKTIQRLSPPAQVQVAGQKKDTAQGAPAEIPGQVVYKKYCSVCHAYGVAGAPKMGDKTAWTERYQKGWETLMKHAINGYKGMPARGHCIKCSDQEIHDSINYMLTNSNVELPK